MDDRWKEVREKVFSRDGGYCVLSKKLPPDLYKTLKENASFLYNTLDPAHVLSRASRPDLKYDEENIVVLNRYSHSMLDQFRHPIDGRQLTKDDVESWWRYIIGNERYERLKNK